MIEFINNKSSNYDDVINNSKFTPKQAFEFLKEGGSVYSGHFHNMDSFEKYGKKFTYIGSPLELTWGERDSKHGFYVLDLDTGKDEFIENVNAIVHKKFSYTELMSKEESEIQSILEENNRNYIQINLDSPEALANRPAFISLINKYGNTNRIKLISSVIDINTENIDFSVNKVSTKFDFITRYLDSIKDEEFGYRGVTKDGMIEMLKEYYLRCVE
jgi:DNA repair exonuclease SbcCD nuclease subunit